MKLEEVNTRTKEAVDFLVAALESGHSEVLTAYLGAIAKFHTYSFGNIMLIARQKPDATNVAGLRAWNSLGRFVKRGEKGVLILAPMGWPQEDWAQQSLLQTPREARRSSAGSELCTFSKDYLVICGRASARSMDSACRCTSR